MAVNLSAADRKALEQDILSHVDDIYYSPRYYDDQYEYRHVNVPKQIVRWMPEGVLMSEDEWGSFVIRQSPGLVWWFLILGMTVFTKGSLHDTQSRASYFDV